ncbi:hypothetical protein O3G_MSEX013998 [Manduca sexta]|uniref:Uncharacterized protein n=3 Tax=Manduca sexta TaxID=7130 RepID=A0A921ZUY2_MANSE|nr:hypothetical protein O3G_MSEX013998 [Manduca sexta]
MWQQGSDYFIFNDPRIDPSYVMAHNAFEDKIKSTDDLSHNALLTQIDENATITFEEALKQVDEIQIFEE